MFNDSAEGRTHYYGDGCKEHPMPLQNDSHKELEQEEWELQLDSLPSDEGGEAIDRMHPTDQDKLKHFIRTLLEAQRKQLAKEIIEEIPNHKHIPCEHNDLKQQLIAKYLND